MNYEEAKKIILELTDPDKYRDMPIARKLDIKRMELLLELDKVEALKDIKSKLTRRLIL